MNHPRFVDCEQRSPEWLAARLGCVTASGIADVMATLKRGGESASRMSYKWQLVAERLSGLTTENYVSTPMQWGIDQEPLAREAYQIAKDVAVEQIGFVYHPTLKWAGASPDGLVGADGLLEIKCPNTETHLQYRFAGVVPSQYQMQMLWQMECAERQWCDFVSYDPRLPAEYQLFVKRFERDEGALAAIRGQVVLFLGEVEEILAGLANPVTLEGQLRASITVNP